MSLEVKVCALDELIPLGCDDMDPILGVLKN